MGISGLLPFLKPATRPCKIKEFSGCTAAVDVYCWLHRAAFGCAEQLVQGRPTDAYIKYIMKFVNMLLYHNIKPILVFDGRNLPSKAETERKRRKNRQENREKAVKLLQEGKVREAREFFQRCVDITPAMAREVIQACRERNVDCIVAPYEADSQLAFLNRSGLAQLVITEDSDLTLFGCSKIIFKLSEAGDGVLYESSNLGQVFGQRADHFNFDKFKYMCIMSGCDYLASLPGIGLGKSKAFWSRVTNPDVRAVLPKIPAYLKMTTVVTQEYIEKFIQADNTFLYQVVFDPATRRQRPLNDYPPEVKSGDLAYCGEFSDHHTAFQLALGNLDLNTLTRVSDFDPDITSRHSVQPRYGTRAPHESIWWRGGDLSVSSPPALLHPPLQPTLAAITIKETEVSRSSCFTGAPGRQVACRPVRQSPRKRRLQETVQEDQVEALLLLEEEETTTTTNTTTTTITTSGSQPAAKRSRLEQTCSSSSSSKFSRLVGDVQVKAGTTTVSRYFAASLSVESEKGGNSAREAEEEEEEEQQGQPRSGEGGKAGGWFSSISRAATTEGRFIYRTEGEEAAAPLQDISNSTAAPVASKLEAFKRQRNPFAVKRTMFAGDPTKPEAGQTKSEVCHTKPEADLTAMEGPDGNTRAVSNQPSASENEDVQDRDSASDPAHAPVSPTMQLLESLCAQKSAAAQLPRPMFVTPGGGPRVGLSRGKQAKPLLTPKQRQQLGSGRPVGLSGGGGGSAAGSSGKQTTILHMFARVKKPAAI